MTDSNVGEFEKHMRLLSALSGYFKDRVDPRMYGVNTAWGLLDMARRHPEVSDDELVRKLGVRLVVDTRMVRLRAVVKAVGEARSFIERRGECPECGSGQSPHPAPDGKLHNPSCFVALMLHHYDALEPGDIS